MSQGEKSQYQSLYYCSLHALPVEKAASEHPRVLLVIIQEMILIKSL